MPRKIRSMKKKRVRTNKRSVKRGGAGLRRTRTNKRSVKGGWYPFKKKTTRYVVNPESNKGRTQTIVYSNPNSNSNSNTLSNQSSNGTPPPSAVYSSVLKRKSKSNSNLNNEEMETPLEVQTYNIVKDSETVYASVNFCSQGTIFEKYERKNAENDLINCNNPDKKPSYLFRINNENFVILSIYNPSDKTKPSPFKHFILHTEDIYKNEYVKLYINKDEPVKLETLLDSWINGLGLETWTNVRQYVDQNNLLHIDPYKKYLSLPSLKA